MTIRENLKSVENFHIKKSTPIEMIRASLTEILRNSSFQDEVCVSNSAEFSRFICNLSADLIINVKLTEEQTFKNLQTLRKIYEVIVSDKDTKLFSILHLFDKLRIGLEQLAELYESKMIEELQRQISLAIIAILFSAEQKYTTIIHKAIHDFSIMLSKKIIEEVNMRAYLEKFKLLSVELDKAKVDYKITVESEAVFSLKNHLKSLIDALDRMLEIVFPVEKMKLTSTSSILDQLKCDVKIFKIVDKLKVSELHKSQEATKLDFDKKGVPVIQPIEDEKADHYLSYFRQGLCQ